MNLVKGRTYKIRTGSSEYPIDITAIYDRPDDRARFHWFETSEGHRLTIHASNILAEVPEHAPA